MALLHARTGPFTLPCVRSLAHTHTHTRTHALAIQGGPSILVYYSPAFVRTLAPSDALAALSLLAEIYLR